MLPLANLGHLFGIHLRMAHACLLVGLRESGRPRPRNANIREKHGQCNSTRLLTRQKDEPAPKVFQEFEKMVEENDIQLA